MMIKPVRKVTSGVFLKRGFGGDVESHKLIDNLKSELLTTLRNRGFLYQCTDYEELDRLADESPIHAYLGFDATAPSLHVGSLIQIMMLRHLQQSGHKPIILIGGGTTKIGDPSGKDQSRQLISDEAIEKNILGISGVFNRFLKFGNGPSDAIIVNNSNWLGKLQYVNFLQEYGRHITLNRMLSFESVKSRLAREEPLTLLEFNYMLLQAYDFLHLHETMGVSLQLGGSDQWGNIICGVELGRKMKKASLYGLTTPLLTTSDGRKMGKSASGAIWLDRSLLSEYDYWQFWRNVHDNDVIRFLRLFTDLPLPQIAAYEQDLLSPHPTTNINSLKSVLADEATTLLHGSECLPSIHSTASALFSSRGTLDLSALSTIRLSVPTERQGVSVIDALVSAQLASSRSDARRKISAGSVRVNDDLVTDASMEICFHKSSCPIKVSFGKKTHVLIVLER